MDTPTSEYSEPSDESESNDLDSMMDDAEPKDDPDKSHMYNKKGAYPWIEDISNAETAAMHIRLFVKDSIAREKGPGYNAMIIDLLLAHASYAPNHEDNILLRAAYVAEGDELQRLTHSDQMLVVANGGTLAADTEAKTIVREAKGKKRRTVKIVFQDKDVKRARRYSAALNGYKSQLRSEVNHEVMAARREDRGISDDVTRVIEVIQEIAYPRLNNFMA